MRAAVRRVSVSHRRGFLVTLGIGWAGYGLGIITDPRYGTARGLANIVRYVPLGTLGWVWVAAGLVAVLAGLLVRCPRIEAVGFVLLAMPAALWGGSVHDHLGVGRLPVRMVQCCRVGGVRRRHRLGVRDG